MDGPGSEDAEDPQTDEFEAEQPPPDTAHLDDVEDGCGCTEVWEHLSEERED